MARHSMILRPHSRNAYGLAVIKHGELMYVAFGDVDTLGFTEVSADNLLHPPDIEHTAAMLVFNDPLYRIPPN